MMKSQSADIDPITTEIIASRLAEIASSMEHALYHSGYSPILRESKDGTAGLTDAQGRVVVIGGGLQYHVIAYQRAVESLLARHRAADMLPGDSFIVNDPYLAGNAHAPDMVTITPCFAEEAIVGFAVAIAHKPDIGGIVPGSSGAAAREIFHDGLLLPPVLFQTADGVKSDIEAIIRNNSRVPDMLLGDLRAQVGCTRMGAQRLADLCEEYTASTLRKTIDRLIALTTKRLRDEISQWTDGEAEAEGFLDHDGATLDQPVRIHVRAKKRGDHLILDFSESAAQTQGPVNLTEHTARAVSLIGLVTSTDPDIPINSGLAGAIEFILPPGVVVNPQHPATVNHYFPTAHLAYNCVVSALGKLNPTRAVAPSGLGCGAVSIGYKMARGGKPAVLYELMTTSLGATAAQDGTSIVNAINHFTPGAPIEIMETEYPVRVRRFDIRPDSGGAGRHRGGIGYTRDLEILDNCMLTVRSSSHRFTAWGVDGGLAPAASSVTLNPDTAHQTALEPIVTRQLAAGDVIRFARSGGGGFGDPKLRPPADLMEDVANGYVTPQSARSIYAQSLGAAEIEPGQKA